MENIRQASDRTLRWTQLGALKREYELRADDQLLAKLIFEKPLGSLARATTSDGEWTLKRSGFLHPTVSVRLAGSDADVAVFRPNWSGAGILELANGSRFTWAHKNFLRSEWAFTGQVKEDILLLKLKPALMKFSVEVKILSDLSEVSLLACLGMYLLVLMHEESTAASASIMPIITV